MADLVARRRRKILRGLRRLHDRRRVAAFFAPVPNGRLRAWRDRRGEPVRHTYRRGHPWRIIRSFRPQADVRRRDDHLRCVPRGAMLRHELHPGGDLPVWAGARTRLRLPDSAHDHLGKHPEFQAWQARARRVRLPGRRRASRHGGRFFRPFGPSRSQRLALDVRERDHSSRTRHARSLLHRRERQLVVRARRHRQGGAGGEEAPGAQAAISFGHQARAASSQKSSRNQPGLCGLVQ